MAVLAPYYAQVMRQTIVSLVDDLDGSDADQTVTFGIDGRSYEIDLSAANAEGHRLVGVRPVEVVDEGHDGLTVTVQ